MDARFHVELGKKDPARVQFLVVDRRDWEKRRILACKPYKEED